MPPFFQSLRTLCFPVTLQLKYRSFNQFVASTKVVRFIDTSVKHLTPVAYSACRQFSTLKTVENMAPSHLDIDMKPQAVDIVRNAISAVSPKAMIENVLLYNQTTSTLNLHNRQYKINKNVFIVGFGNSVLGMARVVEDMLGEHVVTGIISIPSGLKQETVKAHDNDRFLSLKTKLQVYEVAENNVIDEAGHNASKAIHRLVSNLTESDVLIVLCTAGGSALCPSPRPPITLQELNLTIKLLNENGANTKEVNTLRKNLETLKGGGLALAARPAKIISLILSSVMGDKADLVASGPTCLTQPSPHHCLEILHRLHIIDKVPANVKRFLEREANLINATKVMSVQDPLKAKTERDKAWEDVQNVIVGNNSIACQAAAKRASELGYFPLVLTTVLTGEAKDLGALFTKLAKFIMICYDRRAGMDPNPELSMLEVELVAGGIKKQWMNHIATSVYKAHNMNKNICIISGGEIDVNVIGNGIGGKNTETALSAALQMYEEFRVKQMNVKECSVCFLSVDSDGMDGMTKVAGAVVDQTFLDEVDKSKLDMKPYLLNNDSYTFFKQVKDGKYLVQTNLTGTDIMDLTVLMVKQPTETKYVWK
ncbi:glycerate kinase [Biomphalaria glabrata]|nr:glycerate kinase [Biomphalaria glabrata]